MNAKVIKLTKGNLVGEELGPRFGGHAGRNAEDKLRDRGYDLSNGPGADMKSLHVEVKTRAIEATSPHTIATGTVDYFINTDYENSVVYEKTQQQYRIKTENGVVIENEIYDMSNPFIQQDLKRAYETVRNKLINGDRSDIIYGSHFGYLEKGKDTNSSYQFRLSDGAMKKIENTCKSSISTNFIIEV